MPRFGAQPLDGAHTGAGRSAAAAVAASRGIILNRGSLGQDLGCASSYLEPAQVWLPNLPLEAFALKIGRGHFHSHNLTSLISTHIITWKSQSLNSRSLYKVWI